MFVDQVLSVSAIVQAIVTVISFYAALVNRFRLSQIE